MRLLEVITLTLIAGLILWQVFKKQYLGSVWSKVVKKLSVGSVLVLLVIALVVELVVGSGWHSWVGHKMAAGWGLLVTGFHWLVAIFSGSWLDPLGKSWQFEQIVPFQLLKTMVMVSLYVGLAVALIAAIANWWSRRQAKPANVKKKLSAEEKTDLQISRDYKWWLLFTVPYQHSAAVYWNFFGRGKIFRICEAGTYFKPPYVQVVEILDRTEQDVDIQTPQLQTGKIEKVSVRDLVQEAGTERAGVRLTKTAGRELVSGTLSYAIRLTWGIRSEDGIAAILKQKPEYREQGDALKKRFSNLITARLKEPLQQLNFEDAFFVPAMIILLGSTEEMIGFSKDPTSAEFLFGARRWAPYLRSGSGSEILITYDDVDPITGQAIREIKNLFKIDLTKPKQVLAAIQARRESLLAAFYGLGYKITLYAVEDVNPPPDLDAALKKRVVAEIERDAQFTKWVSEIVDKADAERSARNIHADATNYTFEALVDWLYKLEGKHGVEKIKLTTRDLLQFSMFLEDRRTRRLMEGRLTQMDIGTDIPIPAGLAALLGASGKGQ